MKTIPDFPNYSITDTGKVFNNKTGREIKQWTQRCGHCYVGLRKDKKRSKIQVHRLVLETYIGKKKDGQVARHLNDIPDDNRLDNLAWGSYRENSQDYSMLFKKMKRLVIWLEKNHPDVLTSYNQDIGV